MSTTIQVSDEVQQKLEKMKLFSRESYNEILERMLEDELILNEETRKEIEESKKEKSLSHNEVKKKFGL